jgi:hypothetical protein
MSIELNEGFWELTRSQPYRNEGKQQISAKHERKNSHSNKDTRQAIGMITSARLFETMTYWVQVTMGSRVPDFMQASARTNAQHDENKWPQMPNSISPAEER